MKAALSDRAVSALAILLFVLMFLGVSLMAHGAEVTVAWDPATTNTDGTATIDASTYLLLARRCDTVRVTWSNAAWRVSGAWVTNLVVGAIEWIPGPLVETVLVPALTNAPVAGSTQAASFTNLVNNRVFEARAVAVNSRGEMSEPSEGLIFGTGKPAPSRVTLRMVPP